MSRSPFDNADIDDLVAGRLPNPETGEAVPMPFRRIVMEPSLDGAEAELVASVGIEGKIAVVSDANTHDVLGARVVKALGGAGRVTEVVLGHPHADMDHVRSVGEAIRGADSAVAVGSGTVNDLVKYATLQDGRPFAVFATAASMNGYTSTTAAITEDGFKKSLPAHGPRGIFMDLGVIAAAPANLTRAGLGDALCRSTAQVDWRLSRALLGTPYHESPFLLQAEDEGPLLRLARRLGEGDVEAVWRLCRVLNLCGIASVWTGTSHHGSMSEHMVSHYIDMFAGPRHPGTLHGHQVGVAAVTMSRLQSRILCADTPPKLRPTRIDEAGMARRYGPRVAPACVKEFRAKALDAARADALSAEMAADWPAFTAPLKEAMLPTARLVEALAASGGFVTAEEAGLPSDFYREAVIHAREIRSRFSILDVAGDSGALRPFAEESAAGGMVGEAG